MRVLVTTASKHGATAEIGARIGSVLHERGHDVEVLCPSDVRDVEPYDVVVLGSAVYAGRWQEDAKVLAEREASALRHRPVWLFSSGPVGDRPKPEEVPAEIKKVVAATGAYEHHVFAGRIQKEALSLPERAVVKALRVSEGDDRDWNEIERWATTIADSISSG
jgi:menaquinone-dependent protoporphyrinogen oxidase